MLKISNTEIQKFKGCRRRWYLSHYLNLAPIEEERTGPLALGIRVHEALAWYYTNKGASPEAALAFYEQITQESEQAGYLQDRFDPEKFHKEARLGRVMLEGYFDWVESEGLDSNLEVLEPEQEIEAELRHFRVTQHYDEPVMLVGKRDLIGVDKTTGIPMLIDFKTAQSLVDPMLDINEQARMYLLLQLLNGNSTIQNVTWRILRKVQRTGRAVPPFFAEEELYVGIEELRRFYVRVVAEVSDILDVRRRLDEGESHHSACYPRPSRDCSWMCEFRHLCPLMDSEKYVDEYIQANFTKHDPYERYGEKEKDGSVSE